MVEHNPAAPVPDPVAQLDVLDLGPREAGRVEAAQLHEPVPAHRAETGPEGLRRAGPRQVDMPVQQIPILGDQAAGCGTGIVRAKQGDRVALPPNRFDHPSQGVAVHPDVGVHEEEPVAAGMGGPGVAGAPGAPGPPLQGHHAVGLARRHGRRVVPAGVVHYDQFPLRARQIASPQGAERLRQEVRRAVGGDNHGEARDAHQAMLPRTARSTRRQPR
jgi:hypothetical protein